MTAEMSLENRVRALERRIADLEMQAAFLVARLQSAEEAAARDLDPRLWSGDSHDPGYRGGRW